MPRQSFGQVSDFGVEVRSAGLSFNTLNNEKKMMTSETSQKNCDDSTQMHQYNPFAKNIIACTITSKPPLPSIKPDITYEALSSLLRVHVHNNAGDLHD